MKNIIEYKNEYESSINSAILRCLNTCTSTNDKEGFLSLIYYLKEKYEVEMYDIEYYILCAFQNDSIDRVLGNVYESIFNEIIKSLLDDDACNICNFISYHISNINSEFGLSIEYFTYQNFLEGRKFFFSLEELLPDITIRETIDGELQDRTNI